MRKAYTFGLVLLSLLLLAGCTGKEEQKAQQSSALLMDTVVNVKTYDNSQPQAPEQALKLVKSLDSRFSRYGKDSDISRVNAMAGEKPVQVDESTINLIREAVYYGDITRGALDITIGPLVDLWNIPDTDNTGIPRAEEIGNKLKLVNYRQIVLDTEKSVVYLPYKGSSLDLGSLAKGFANRRVAEMLREKGVRSALISLGGNIYAIGSKPDGEPWQIAIQDPFDQNQFIAVFNIIDRAVDTAGGYYRFKEIGGEKFSHIINPSTGIPAGEIASVTVITDDPLKADALSTASYVLGEEKGMALLESVQGVSGFIVTKSGKVVTTSNFMDEVPGFKLRGERKND
ncbi:FAD:protein FMN transferase [Pelotomaculum propionicicum]|uniref:FAD:protein FMN transferase n=1 Tax=Pelotomaculum propionicicum TaxID=258475 RepID=UPI003B78A775